VLIVANLAVAVWVLRRELGYYELILIYWCETVIIALYNIGRLLVVFLFGEPFGKTIDAGSWINRLVSAAVFILLFVFMFGFFALMLGFWVAMVPAFLVLPEKTAGNAVWNALRSVGPAVWTSIGFLLVSHGVSFLLNFLLRREYKKAKLIHLLFWPVARAAAMILVIAVGLVVARVQPMLGRSTAFALTILLVKLAADLAAHQFEHRRVLGKAS
jgi:hypothetical protein